jgi:2-polyprenyl-6-methoxyphenol hydroxylase-like FAD-dependent oxidoreductase
MSKPVKVLVIGGGIGGLALGHALRGADIDVEIYERNATLDQWVDGHRLNINQIGSRSLHACLPGPLWDAFVATSVVPHAGLAFRTEHLRDLVVVGKDVLTGGATGPVGDTYAVSRTVLRNLLFTGLDDVVRLGKTFERYEDNADGTVTAHFADGTSATGDVLVGADGASSRVRGQYLPDANRIETDAVSVAGRLPLTDETLKWLPAGLAAGMNCIIPSPGRFMFTSAFDGRRRMTSAIDHGHDLAAAGLDADLLLEDLEDYVLWAFIGHDTRFPANLSTMDGKELAALVAGMASDWHPALRRIIAETDPAGVGTMRFKRSTWDVTWGQTRVTLIGDAIHNMPPVMGLGANIALRDAAELSALLANSAPDAAIAAYEARMRDYGFEAVRNATRYTEMAISDSPVTRQGMKTWLRLCGAVPAIKRRSFGHAYKPGIEQSKETVGAR